MTLSDSLREYIAAAFSGIWIEGHEHRYALVEIASLCRYEQCQLPTELYKLFVVVEHPLPHRRQLHEIAQGVAIAAGEMLTGVELERLLDAAAGLTRQEAENAFSLSLVRHSRLQVETLWELKSQVLKKSGLLQLHRGREQFHDLGGLESLKAFCKRALRGSSSVKAKPRGILLLSPPGCGKSAFAKAL